MLKCVVFWVTPYYYEILLEKLREIRKKAAEAQIEIIVQVNETDIPRVPYAGEETLFISDSAETLEKLLSKNRYAIALYHNKNKNKSFPRALYAVEDVEWLESSSYEEVYRRLAGIPWDILETERLKVRESTVEDIEAFYRIYEEPSITRYMENLFPEAEEEKAYMEAYIKQIYGFYGYGLWTVALKEGGEIIGRAGLSIREGYDLPELGFAIEKKHQQKGYGFEVCRGILEYAEKKLSFSGVQALVKKENEASLRLLEKLGFAFNCNVVEKNQNYLMFVKKV